MKKVAFSFAAGVLLTLSTTALASSEQIQAWLFPSSFQINGVIKQAGEDYVVLNYKDHAYVPIRFVAEQLGAGVGYNDRDQIISIEDEPQDGSDFEQALWNFKYNVLPGSSQQHVENAVGSAAYSNTEQNIWRYDLAAHQDYASNTITADTEAIQQGKVKGQVFIYWTNNNTVDHISIWYSKDSNVIQIYNLDSNGSFTEAVYE